MKTSHGKVHRKPNFKRWNVSEKFLPSANINASYTSQRIISTV